MELSSPLTLGYLDCPSWLVRNRCRRWARFNSRMAAKPTKNLIGINLSPKRSPLFYTLRSRTFTIKAPIRQPLFRDCSLDQDPFVPPRFSQWIDLSKLGSSRLKLIFINFLPTAVFCSINALQFNPSVFESSLHCCIFPPAVNAFHDAIRRRPVQEKTWIWVTNNHLQIQTSL